MRLFTTAVLFMLLLVTAFSAFASDETNSRTEYMMAVADYFKVSYEDVVSASETGIADEELPVVFWVAEQSKSSTIKIANLRGNKKSWLNIAKDHKLTAVNFYVMVVGKIESGAFATVFSKFNNTPKYQWKEIALEDSDIVNLVNLRMIYSHHDYSPFVVMKMRDFNRSFVAINQKIREAKDELIRKEVASLNESAK